MCCKMIQSLHKLEVENPTCSLTLHSPLVHQLNIAMAMEEESTSGDSQTQEFIYSCGNVQSNDGKCFVFVAAVYEMGNYGEQM